MDIDESRRDDATFTFDHNVGRFLDSGITELDNLSISYKNISGLVNVL